MSDLTDLFFPIMTLLTGLVLGYATRALRADQDEMRHRIEVAMLEGELDAMRRPLKGAQR
jgi:hypothetical protein